MRRLLGAPHLPLLQMLLRETGQNSCDALAGSEPLRLVVRLRRLSTEQRDALCQAISAMPPPSKSSRRLAETLAQPAPLVLEICDFGTRGLGGPTRADRSIDGVRNDFVDFVRNIGVSRDVAQSGGTYGYGKSILYRTSRCSTIIVDSLTLAGEHRLIGCHLGDTVERGQERLTGRHWWGVPSSEIEDFVEPVIGARAAELAASLGLLARQGGQTGTSIMVLDPELQDDDAKSCGGEIIEALLWFFWPRMIAIDGVRRMVCEVEVEGELLPVPDPEQFPPLDLFAEAWRAIKAGGVGAREVRSERPIRRLGTICLRTGLRNPRLPLTTSGRTMIPQTSAHIAVMRPVDLVVRYFEGPAFPNELQEWAGVFICDAAPDVEAAFALAEPPAHDDWDPEAMPKGPAKTYVNVALREIRRAAALWAMPPAIRTDGSRSGMSLARAADILGAVIPDPRGRRLQSYRGGHNARGWQVRDPEFIGLREGPRGVEAVFRVRAVNLGLVALRVEARPGLVLDGVLSGENAGPHGDLALVIAWTNADGQTLATGDFLPLAPGASLDCNLSIAVPRLSAVGVAIVIGVP